VAIGSMVKSSYVDEMVVAMVYPLTRF